MRRIQRPASQFLRTLVTLRPLRLTPFLPHAHRVLTPSISSLLRHASTTPASPPKTLPHRPAPHRNPDEPIYELTFTCKACKHRSAHTISKQGYHKGTVLITCPGCKNRHLISDHLRIFSDTRITLEDIMASKGETIQKGSVDAEGDIEFWSEKAVSKAEDADAGNSEKKD